MLDLVQTAQVGVKLLAKGKASPWEVEVVKDKRKEAVRKRPLFYLLSTDYPGYRRQFCMVTPSGAKSFSLSVTMMA